MIPSVSISITGSSDSGITPPVASEGGSVEMALLTFTLTETTYRRLPFRTSLTYITAIFYFRQHIAKIELTDTFVVCRCYPVCPCVFVSLLVSYDTGNNRSILQDNINVLPHLLCNACTYRNAEASVHLTYSIFARVGVFLL